MEDNTKRLHSGKSYRIFWWITDHPIFVASLGMMFVVACLAFIPKLVIDPKAESFLPKDSPALVYREQVEEIFGLKDPMVIAVVNKNGVFNPDTIQLVDWLTQQVLAIPEVNQDRVISLTTEDNIVGNEEGLVVTPFVESLPVTQDQANEIAAKVKDFPLYLGSVVARDSTATLIITEVTEDSHAPIVYEKLMTIIAKAPIKNTEILHVAGDGAVSGYLSAYIISDAARLVPISVVIITLLCVLAFRTVQGSLLPGIVILAATASSVGIMAAMGDPIYVITTSMPILLVGIAVADAIHIKSEYYEQRALTPTLSKQALIVHSVNKMAKPVLLTTLTSMIGFLGVYFSSYMPPMKSFGVYSMIGLAVAGIFSLAVIPAMQMLMPTKDSAAFTSSNTRKGDKLAQFMDGVGRRVLANPNRIIIGAIVVVVMGIYGASKLEVNESWVDNFQTSEPIYQADIAINKAMDGTSNLDIVIQTPHQEDLFLPENLRKIEALQFYLESMPEIGGTTSIVDYIKQMNRALNNNDPSEYRIPDDADLISQYFLLYSASGDPTDFEEEVDYDYQQALVRARLHNGRLQFFKPVVENAQTYIDENFNTRQIEASLSGRIYVDYEWLTNLTDSHFKGVAFALVLVWIVASLSFKSILGGTLALVPVGLATFAVYALMGALGITLAVGTTMTAVIALGIGIDFAIHTIERIKYQIQVQDLSPSEALQGLYPSTGRALLFNFLAVFIGFGVLGLSHVPPLAKLGVLIAFAVLVSFVASITVLPALIKLLKPRFIGFKKGTDINTSLIAEVSD